MRDVYSGHTRLYGVDVELEALRRNEAIPLRAAALGERLPFAANSFELLVAAWVLEHLEAPAEFAREAVRVLAPGGRFVFLTPNVWNYNVWLIRAVPNQLHDAITRRLYGRQDRDTFPVRYRMNSARKVDRVLADAGMRRLQLVMNGDPSYVSFNRPLFELACAAERLLDVSCLNRARVHLVGVYEKPVA